MTTKEKFSDRRHNQRRQDRKPDHASETLLSDQNKGRVTEGAI